jgi:ribosomal protein L37E
VSIKKVSSVSCNKCGEQSYNVSELKFGTLVARVCDGCRSELVKELKADQHKADQHKVERPKVDSKEWRRRAFQVALSFAPAIRPCKDCGWPVAEGYQCGCGGSADRNLEAWVFGRDGR